MTNLSAVLDARAVEAYWRDGWLRVPSFVTDERLRAWQLEADRLLGRPELFDDRRGELLNGTPRRDRLDPVVDESPIFAAAAQDRAILDVVATVLGGAPQLFKDKFIAKPPAAIGYAAHQDLVYWPGFDIDGDRLVTAMVFLDEASVENGTIACSSGQHRRALTPPGVVADPDGDQVGELVPIVCDAGDLVLLHSLTPHGSGANESDRMRRALLFTYAVDDRPDLYGEYQRRRRQG